MAIIDDLERASAGGVTPRQRRARGRWLFATATGTLAIVALALAGTASWWLQQRQSKSIATGIAEARAGTRRAAQALGAELGTVPPQVEAIARDLAAGTLEPASVAARIRADVERGGRAIRGLGVAFDPASGQKRLFAPYVELVDRGRPYEVDIGAVYPYTEYRYGWYCDTLLDGAGWLQTRLLPERSEPVVVYTMPFTLPGAAGVAGVVFASIKLEALSRSLQSITIGQSGYAFILGGDGRYLVHPRRELVRRGRTIFETAWETDNEGLHTLGVRALQGETLDAGSTDELTGRDNWLFAEPLATTKWTLIAVFFRDEFRPDINWQRRQWLHIISAGLAGIWLAGAAAFAIAVRSTTRFQWACSTSLAIILACGIGLCWYIADRDRPRSGDGRTLIFDEASAHQYLRSAGLQDGRRSGEVALIPTGVFVRAASILSGSEVSVSGYIWQRYELGRHDSIPRGFVLPETFDPGQSEVRELYRQKTDTEERIGWYFAVKFRQEFNYGKFPFDRQSIWVRLEPPEGGNDVVFVPDFRSYELMNPVMKPGVSDSLVLPGWDVLGAHFDYRTHSYNADFGLPGGRRERTPELYFNVEVRRRFLSPFIAYMVPLGVTAGMLFALLLISSRQEKAEGLLGFSAAEIVLGTAALFFVASFQHIAVRESLHAVGLMYLEYFYLVIYVLMMLVSINAISYASASHVRIVEYEDNLIPKLVYWPLCTMTLYLITLGRFY